MDKTVSTADTAEPRIADARHRDCRSRILPLLASVAGVAFSTPALAQVADGARVPGRTTSTDAAIPAAKNAVYAFDIAPQPLSSALTTFAQQSDARTLFNYGAFGVARGNSVRGRMSRTEALVRLLEGTQFRGHITPDGVVTLQPIADVQPDERGANDVPLQRFTPLDADVQRDAALSVDEEEIIVTGTRIRGQAPVGARVISIDRRDIAETGYATTGQLLRSLPQSLGAAYDQNVNLSNSANISGGTGVNLRGLGADATLVLVDGRRLPSAGRRGDFTDVSGLPVGLIERVEILPDSASAVYGSDAVGGVVNFVLRASAPGPEVATHFGAVTRGDLEEYRVSALTGGAGDSWRYLLAAEHYDRSPLANADRDYLATSDLRALGGADFRSPRANPANLNVTGVGAFAVPAGQNGAALTQARLIPGGANRGNLNQGLDATPAQTLDLLYASGGLNLNDDVSLFASTRTSSRTYAAAAAVNNARLTLPATNAFRLAGNLFPGRVITVDYDFFNDLGPRRQQGTVRTLDLGAGGEVAFGDTWRGTLSFAYAREATTETVTNIVNSTALAAALADSSTATALNVLGDGSFTNPATLARLRGYFGDQSLGETWSANLKADGALWDLPAGPLRLALGGEFRSEFFGIESDSLTSGTTPVHLITAKGDREITAGFVEVLAPLLGGEVTLPFAKRLDLSLALRAERYSDFGETSNPRVGVRFDPVDAVSLRAAWGRSFRAPNLADLDTVDASGRREVRLLNFADPFSVSGRSDGLVIVGANPALKEQTAESFTAGVSISPDWTGKPVLDIGYFDVQFDDRIATVPVSTPTLSPQSEYAQFVNRTPTLAQATALLQEAALRAPIGAITPGDIDLVIDARTTNLAVTNVRGLDAHVATTVPAFGGELSLSGDVTWVISFERAATAIAPVLEVSDTFANPIDIKARIGAAWRRETPTGDTFSVSAFLNYADNYLDRGSLPARAIDRWTTTDLRLAYAPSPRSRGLGFRPGIAFAILNVFDEEPPFVNNASGVGYDPANANPLGRFVSIDLTARF